MTLGERLREAREYTGLSLAQAAKQLRWPLHQLATLEAGATPTDLEFAALSRLYEVRAEVLRDGAAPVTEADVSEPLRRALPTLDPDDRREVLRFAQYLRDKPKARPGSDGR